MHAAGNELDMEGIERPTAENHHHEQDNRHLSARDLHGSPAVIATACPPPMTCAEKLALY
jgi:hypothetical protein